MSKQITRLKAEEILEKRFKGKFCKFDYPGYAPVYGMVDQIAIEELTEPLVIIQMNDRRYKVSPGNLKECLTLLKKENGNSY